MTKSRAQIDGLTGIRFFAALHVVIFHCTDWATSDHLLLRRLASTGFVAVDLFFVLSGFILTYTNRGGPLGREFYVARAARVYPVYAFGLLLAAPFFLVAHARAGTWGRLLVEGVSVVGLVQAYVPSLAMAWNPPAWSLSNEATFYLLFPFLLPAIRKMTPQRAMLIGLVAWLVSMGLAGGYLLLSPDGIAGTTFHTTATWLDVLKYNPLVRLPEFVVGMTLGHVFNEGRSREAMQRLAPGLGPAAVLLIAAVLVIGAPYPLLHNALVTPLFGLLIYAVATDRGLLARLLGWRPLVVLGEASYALYMLHLTLFVIARKVWTASGARSEGGAFFPIFLLAALVTSIATYRYLELPMRSWLRSGSFGRVPSQGRAMQVDESARS